MAITLPPYLVIDLRDAMGALRRGLPELQASAHEEMLRQVFDYFFNSPQGRDPFQPEHIPYLVSSILPGLSLQVIPDAELDRMQLHFYDLYRAVATQLVVYGLDRLADEYNDLPYVLHQLSADHRIILRLIPADEPRY